MKRVLLFLSIITATAVNAQFLPCVAEYRINNGGGNCPDLNGVQATGSVTASFDDPVSPGFEPQIFEVYEVTQSGNVLVEDVFFGPGTLKPNGDVVFCYYLGPNNTNNLLGANAQFVFIVNYEINGQTYPCRPDGIPLPVKFANFTATRSKSNVSIKWETSQEINNLGFTVQRNVRGSWENVAFVNSQAIDGNSNSPLSYSFSDLNTTKGVTQYRIMQVDLDGKSKYSDIRSVKGEAMSGKTLVYPNPSLNGNVNVVFDDQQPKNVVISDMNGRVIRKYNSAVNNLSVDNLDNGVYSIQVIDLSTSAVSVEKVVVKKR